MAEARQKLLNTQALTTIDFSSKVEEGQKQLAELENQISETSLTLKYQRIKAPVSGVVFDLKPTAAGFVVSGNVPEPVMKIVPNGSIQSDVKSFHPKLPDINAQITPRAMAIKIFQCNAIFLMW